MKYRTHRGIPISEVGIGLYSVSGAYGTKDMDDMKRMLSYAVDNGVTFFDTAEGYGSAEQVLGEAVKGHRDQVYIATKVGMREGVQPNLSPEYIREACSESLRRLQTDYIDLYQVHFDDVNTPVEETVRGLQELVDDGKINHYGVGHLGEDRVEEYCRSGDVFTILMELSAVARRSRQTLLPLCRRFNAGGIAFSTTGRGLLTGKVNPPFQFEPGDIRWIDPLFQRENLTSALRITEKFIELGEFYDRTPAQVAIAWVLAQPGIICALTGPSTRDHCEEDVGGSGWSISPYHLRELERMVEEEEKKVKEEQRSTLRHILIQPLASSFSDAFRDMLYLLETAVGLELVQEEEILPLFHKLMSVKGSKDRTALEPIHREACSLIAIT
jgi:aryl-alcohol dehydrogenase-like predicted oxidoreductase